MVIAVSLVTATCQRLRAKTPGRPLNPLARGDRQT